MVEEIEESRRVKRKGLWEGGRFLLSSSYSSEKYGSGRVRTTAHSLTHLVVKMFEYKRNSIDGRDKPFQMRRENAMDQKRW